MNETLLKEFRIQNSGRTTGLTVGLLSWNANSSTTRGQIGSRQHTLTPKTNVDRGIAESLADFAAGRSFGPFRKDRELIKSLHQEAAKVRSLARTKRKLRK
jgi:hypothetical protein